jgi:hypothetical protein
VTDKFNRTISFIRGLGVPTHVSCVREHPVSSQTIPCDLHNCREIANKNASKRDKANIKIKEKITQPPERSKREYALPDFFFDGMEMMAHPNFL